ncbi:MAG: lactate utilization protein [Desulfurococcales archaeon]|nr:lactate utilization protein [Desulfurococcales archaeon]
MASIEEIIRRVYKALEDEEFQEALWKASLGSEVRVPRILQNYEYIRELAREVTEARKKSIDRLDELIEELKDSARKTGVKLFLADTAEDAREYIGGIIGKGKLVVLSKSMVAEEIGLREYLEEKGNEVWETDLGQLLIQLEGSKPMHTIAPAVHMTVERAARLVREKLGLEIPDNPRPEDIVAEVRRFLREKFTNADYGISGANAIAADTAAVVLVENEGNIRLVTGLPPSHIIVAGMEKIVETLELAVKQAMVQAAYASIYPPTYINIIAGPSSTADIEHTRVYGAHGPREVHLVLVDNGRMKARETPLRDQLRCIRCGRCQWECPVWRHTANIWGGPTYGGPMGINWTGITLGVEEAGPLTLLCLQCRRCDVVCPVEIPISRIIHWLRRQYMDRLLLS